MAKTRYATILVSAGTALGAASKWFLIWLFARSAGGADIVGAYSVILAVATPLFVVSQLGLRTIFLSSHQRWPLGTYWRLRLVGVAVGTAALLTFVGLSPGMHNALGAAITALKICDSVLDLQLARVQYAGRLAQLGLTSVVSAALTITTAAISVWLTGSAIVAIWLSAACIAAVSVWTHVIAKSISYDGSNGSSKGTLPILRASVPVTMSQFLSSLLFQLPVLLLASIASTQMVGIFAGAAYLLTAANLIGSTLQTLLITPFRRIRETSGIVVLKVRSIVIARRALLVAVPFGVLVVAFGAPVLRLVYGPEFNLDAVSLVLLAVGAVATTSAFILSVTLTVLNRYHYVTAAMGLSCLASVGAGGLLLLTPAEPLVIASAMAAVGAVSRLSIMRWGVKNA